MNNKYPFKKIEKKWKEKWDEAEIYKAENGFSKKKFYGLIEFPYPSGQGLHVGHPRSYTAMDVICRKRRMEGYNVLFPIGWDAFGLPAENYAIKTGIHPKIAIGENINNFRKQLKSIGFSFDWSREINTTDPKYYKWTQWIFLQLFKHGLAYKKSTLVNWCPNCNTVLANEEVIDGECERCGTEVIRKEREQWMLKITEYADRLIEDLDLVDYPERVKKQQTDWIGRSEGAMISFELVEPIIDVSMGASIDVFTTRPDTIFGATFLVLSPEHPLVKKITNEKHKKEVFEYQKNVEKKSDLERTELQKEKTGVFTGAYAINPANNKKIPIWISEYVLMSYGTGAIMSVPAHDKRDFEFAKKYNLSIVQVISKDGKESGLDSAYEDWGILINSGKFNGMKSEEAINKIIKFIHGKKDVRYKLRDWIFSRQRYWGEPIPLIYCEKCAEDIKSGKINENELSKGEKLNPGWMSVLEDELPVKLPEIKEFRTTEEGDSPLALDYKWVDVECLRCGHKAKRETDTMPQWAGSSWYYLRYVDPNNNKKFADEEILKYWMPVDWYNGGMEHTTLHLLYSRFWHKFLYDIKAVPTKEPYMKRTSHGLILGEGGGKMSKSKGNVVNPDNMVDKFGADTFRVYEMFMGPFEDAIPWNNKGMLGVERFLNKVWKIFDKVLDITPKNDMLLLINKTIKRISEDMEKMKFNTAISALMIMSNKMNESKNVSKDIFEIFIKLLYPFAPFISEELWEKLGHKNFLQKESWPRFDEKFIKEDRASIAIQENGKTRGIVEVPVDSDKEFVIDKIKEDKKLSRLSDKIDKSKKIIFVKNRIINFVG